MYKHLSEGLLFCLRAFYLESVYVGESTFLFAQKILENEGSCIEVFSASNFAFCGLADLLHKIWAAACSCEKNN